VVDVELMLSVTGWGSKEDRGSDDLRQPRAPKEHQPTDRDCQKTEETACNRRFHALFV